MTVNQSPRFLISRLSHIGDCVLTLPMVCAIRKKFPSSFVAWAIEPAAYRLLKGHPDVDEFVEVPKGWMGKPRVWLSIARRLRALKCDYAIDPQGMTKSAMLSRLSGARHRIGPRGRWGRELSPWVNNWLVQTERLHLVDRSLELVHQLGIIETEVDFRLPICARANDFADQFLKGQAGSHFVVINPGAGWESKRWETDRFAKIAQHLERGHSLPSVVSWAGRAEKEMAERIARLAGGSTVLAPETDLQQLAALLDRATFFIGCDTGPMHIATAMKTPCIGLYGTTRPEESGAYGTQNIAVQKWYQSGSSRQRRSAVNQAMRDIQVEDVMAACDQMLARLDRASGKLKRAA